MKSKKELEKSPAYWKEKAENWKWRYDQLLEQTKVSSKETEEKITQKEIEEMSLQFVRNVHNKDYLENMVDSKAKWPYMRVNME